MLPRTLPTLRAFRELSLIPPRGRINVGLILTGDGSNPGIHQRNADAVKCYFGDATRQSAGCRHAHAT